MLENSEKIYLVITETGGLVKALKTTKNFEDVYKDTVGKNNGELIVELDKDDLENIFNACGLVKLECPECKHSFLITCNYEGAVTCPYCGALVEDN